MSNTGEPVTFRSALVLPKSAQPKAEFVYWSDAVHVLLPDLLLIVLNTGSGKESRFFDKIAFTWPDWPLVSTQISIP